ncbi:sensor histidine kinase [Deminuibacter soli]|uniref:histidine kinase n=1 Tax=Deminuibacter soli TaxID=2291815 RepID=A0A3E1NDC7_9BACT|nr:7TM diverse intracellular signaling domain-containing protein [Deminuibacter soli]RFM25841.1 GHKL domain-containing protein [Deminuibacter soli]
MRNRKQITLRLIYLFVALVLGGNSIVKAQAPVITNEAGLTCRLSVLEDKTAQLDADAVKNAAFTPLQSNAVNYGLSNSAYWIKIDVTNPSPQKEFLFGIRNGTITEATLYVKDSTGHYRQTGAGGSTIPVSLKIFRTQYPVFDMYVPQGNSVTYLLRIKSDDVLDLPFQLNTESKIHDSISADLYIFGIYLGIILIMFLYNLFIYLSVKDSNYLYYVLYILTIGITQASLKGFSTRFFWPDSPWLISQAHNVSIALSGIGSLLFVLQFLHVKRFSKRVFYFFLLLMAVYVAGIVINLSGNYMLSQQILQQNATVVALSIMSCGIWIMRKGVREAVYFNISWFFFLAGVIIYILKDAGILPFNDFTSNSILIGSGLEVSLLSFALADKINTYKKEKEESQAMSLRISQLNEQLVREQNVVLERKVTERTEALQQANAQLSETLQDLKEAQMQLVEAEKMASLGQLTAGIAHEINNPINFVKSNIKPLRLDIRDLFEVIGEYDALHSKDINDIPAALKKIDALKTEIDMGLVSAEITNLIKGIEDGAERTAEIVRGLRTFSRLDESELKLVNVHDGIESTLVLLRNNIPHQVSIIKKFEAEGNIECYPGKLNQVFMNILNNSVQAINAKKDSMENEFISILTRDIADNCIEISIKDSGIGMTEEVKQKIFEPFFTTKEVGEGTGLGMAIVFKIIGSHHGKINIVSEPGKGAEFIITLPYLQSII